MSSGWSVNLVHRDPPFTITEDRVERTAAALYAEIMHGTFDMPDSGMLDKDRLRLAARVILNAASYHGSTREMGR